jgi:hypothetical protein
MEADPTGVKKILRKLCKLFCGDKFDGLEALNKLLKRYKVSELTQEEIESLCSPPLVFDILIN